MAWLELEPSGRYHIAFRLDDRKFKKSLGTTDKRKAEARLHRLEENLRLVEAGRVKVPDDADPRAFLLSDGKLNGKPKARRRLTLCELFEAYRRSVPEGSVEAVTISGNNIHMRHLERILGPRLNIQTLGLLELQGYVDQRSKEPGLRGRTVSATTIKKEMVTLGTVWKWAKRVGHVKKELAKHGLRYPKAREKPPFQTWAGRNRSSASSCAGCGLARKGEEKKRPPGTY